jgi:pimeloyl-ACP methyl ester carboxylesterase
MCQQEILDLKTYNNQPLPNTYFKQKRDTDHLALLLPGRGYTTEMPLFFYPALLLLERGVDVLRLDVNYSEREDFQALEMNEQLRHLFAEVVAAYQAGMARQDYRQVTLVGKSLGTLAMGHLLTSATLPPVVNAIWLTPLLRFDFLREQIKTFAGRSLFVIGTADPHYDAQCLAELQQAATGEVVTIEGADHGMNIAGDVSGSIKALGKIVQAIDAFLE